MGGVASSFTPDGAGFGSAESIAGFRDTVDPEAENGNLSGTS